MVISPQCWYPKWECLSVTRDKTGAEQDWPWVQGGRWTFQCIVHFQQSCSEVAVFSHLAQVGFNSRVSQRSLPLPSRIVTSESILTSAGKTQVKSLACLVIWLLMHFDYGFTTNWAGVLQQFSNFYLQKILQERLRAGVSCVHIPRLPRHITCSKGILSCFLVAKMEQ